MINKIINRLLIEAKDKLLIADLGNKIKVGPYDIIQHGNVFRIMREDVDIDEFNSKKAVIAYAISLFNRLPTKTIKDQDMKIGKYRDDIRFYRRSLLIAQKKHDYTREEVMMCRIDAAFRDLNITKHRLLEEIKNIKIA